MKKIKISNYNGYRAEDLLVIYNAGETTQTNKYGFEAVVVENRVTDCGGNNKAIPKNGFVVSGHGKAAVFLADEICIGAKVAINGDFLEITVDDESRTRLAQSRIEIIEKRIERLEEQKAEYDRASAKMLLEKAYNAIHRKDFDSVKDIFEKAYYITTESVENELRAVWHRPFEKSLEEVEKTVRKFANIGVNIMLIEVNYEGYANALKCACELLPPRKEYENGFDVIEAFINIGKKYGMEIHAWYENFFYGFKGQPCALAEKHKEWLANRKDGNIYLDGYDNFIFLNPALPEVRAFLLERCKELLDKYDFDGFQLDYIRYPAIRSIDRAAGFDNASVTMFLEETGIDIRRIETVNCEEWQKYTLWCAEKVTDYVKSVYELIQDYRKNGRFICLSTAVVGDPWEALRERCQDWRYWIKQGWLDTVYPMAYYNDAVEVEKEVEYMVANYGEAPNISGIAPMYNSLPIIETTKQIEACRKAGAKGIAFFSATTCRDEELETLKIGVYRK